MANQQTKTRSELRVKPVGRIFGLVVVQRASQVCKYICTHALLAARKLNLKLRTARFMFCTKRLLEKNASTSFE